MTLVKIGDNTYQQGDTPQDKAREHVTRNALVAVASTVFSIAGLGTIGVPLVSIVGIGAIGLQLSGILLIAWDHVDSQEEWEEQDKLTEVIAGSDQRVFETRVTATINPELNPNSLPVYIPDLTPIVDLVPNVQPREIQQVAAKPTFSSASLAKTVIEPVLVSTNIVEVIKAPTEDVNVANILATQKYSYAIMSPSGGGKGVLVSIALRLIKKNNPEIHLFLVDPKDDEKERGYWEGVVDTWHRCNFNDLRVKDKNEFVENAIEQYMAIKGPKILIFDEATNVFSHLKNCHRSLLAELKSFLSGIASSGNSRKNYVWLIGHSGNLSDYGISGGEMSCFRKFYIAPTSNIEAIEQLGRTTFAGGMFGDDTVDYIKMLAGKSPVSRAVYIGTSSTWEPMGLLENHSGYNRDEDIFMGDTVTVKATPVSDVKALYDRALHQATKSKDVDTFMELQKMKSDLDNPMVISRLESICLAAI